ncbi:MAG TPA: phosphoenolpyruvate--protein phosphotransferase [Acidimicrobiia bacterium]|nr:phosphoenolpyruvate--protein phosphotransferase [Acidimicrobiia bacterium]
MIGVVIVSHSHTLAEGVAELAREMGGGEVKVVTAGGLDEPGNPIGTDAVRVMAAIEQAWSEDGVLVLMDLGSALLCTDMALEMLTPEQREKVVLSAAPLVEGAVAAVVQARLGSTIEEAASEAAAALGPKEAQLAQEQDPAERDPAEQALIPFPGKEVRAPGPGEREAAQSRGGVRLRITVGNPLGLHARPAARFVQTVAQHDAQVEVTNLRNGRGPAPGKSLNGIAMLGVRQGDEIEVTATGPGSSEVLAALQRLADDDFGDHGPPPAVLRQVTAVETEGAPLRGIPAAPGIAIGPARRLEVADIPMPTGPTGSPDEELKALEVAIKGATADITVSAARVVATGAADEAAIFDAHRLILEDEALLVPVRTAIEGGASAATAWIGAVASMAGSWRTLDDPYMAARADDVDAVGRQVLARLAGVDIQVRLSAPGLVIANELTPGETAGLDRSLVRGLACAAGGPTSHSAILARALGIPAVVALGPALLAVEEGITLVVDGDAGLVVVDPSDEVAQEFQDKAASRAEVVDAARRDASQPAVTADGVRIEVAANIGSIEDAAAAVEAGAEGVGLLRTEFLFLDRAAPPSEDDQEAVYRQVAETMGGLPVILRTLDVGGDKPLPYLPRPEEANPFLGVRGVRLQLNEPDLFEPQLRAAVRVAADHPLRVMFPMVADAAEARAARDAVVRVQQVLAAEGRRVPDRIEVGVMVEVPSAALTAGRLAEVVDFFSIGTNDLTQYALAAERGNPALGALNDPLHPAVLRLIATTVEGAKEHGRWVGVCGEVAGDPLAAPLLIGLGVTELSMSPPAIPLVKAAIRQVDTATASRIAQEALGLANATEVRELLANATDKAVTG